MAYHVGKNRFIDLVDEAVATVPEAFKKYVDEVRLEVADRPTAEQESSVGMKQDGLLLGLYVGRPRTERSVWDTGLMPDSIWIFQSSIERVVSTEAELVEQVRKTVLHEIGHHFGLDERELADLGYG